jgi:hypothetical protein
LRLAAKTLDSAAKILSEAGSSRFEFDALDVAPDSTDVLARLTGPAAALKILAGEVFARWPGTEERDGVWNDLREFRWADSVTPLVKVALSPSEMTRLGEAAHSRFHLSAGGNVAFLLLKSADQCTELDERLRELGLAGVTLRGDGPLWLGRRARPAIARAVKQALDPQNRFPDLDD